MISSLVSSVWLRNQLINGLKNIRIVDASWDMDSGSEGGREQFNQERIESAAFFDIDEVSDKASVYDHMLPSPQVFQQHVGKMGIANHNHVIVYDSNEKYGLFSAPRVWWMFRVFGHDAVSVLDGGLPYWKQCHYPLENGAAFTPLPQQYTVSYRPELVNNIQQVQDHLSTGSAQMVDARSEGRFSGTDPEPRPSLPSGHMIGAKNVPFKNLLNGDTKLLKSKDELRKEFASAGVDISMPMVSTCGSGITACVVALAAHLLNHQVPVYDGSWVEWVQAAPPSTRTNSTTIHHNS